ncbi:MAG: RnfABCDGE type electron transport complex subunit D [Bacteroidales bacterium]|nr:RnfABCDGE type electron transport complex subunit D [Bacteroidales bacterium]
MLNVSLSPHVHSGNSTRKCMAQVLVALVPALLWSFYQFGLGALIVTLSSVAFCVLFEFLITRLFLKTPTTIGDLSAVVTGVLLAFNVPSNIDIWIIAIGALVAIGVAKMSFGGLGCNIFNPALAGRIFLLIAYPVQMTTWPTEAGYADVATGATPLALIGQYVNGADVTLPSLMDCLVGNTGGSLGEVSAIALLIGGAYLLIRKTITWHIPVAVLLSAFVFGFLFFGFSVELAVEELLCGGMMLGAIFMATDYVSSPMNSRGQLIYGVCIGFLTMVIRRYGAYPEGMSFAIFIMNAFTPLINKYVKPQRFGVVKK